MIPSEQFGQIPRVGVEIEVVRWGDSNSIKPRSAVCQDLIDEGFMDSSVEQPFTNNFHPYNCRCHVCNRWEVADADPFPVQFTLEYDASLPDIGGEFITSPFPALEQYYGGFFTGWDIITKNAVRDVKMRNREGTPSSPSVHVHASCVNPENYDHLIAASLFEAFAPEIFGFASYTGLDRGMTYRHTDNDERSLQNRHYAHHRFFNLKQMNTMLRQRVGPHVELRVWEAEYDDPDYIRGALFITAGLTQLASNASVANKMIAYTIMSDRTILALGPDSKDCNPILGEVKPEYFDILYDALTRATFINYDQYAYDTVTRVFEKTRRFLNV